MSDTETVTPTPVPAIVVETSPVGSWFYNIHRDILLKAIATKPLEQVVGPPKASKTRTVTELTEQGYVGLYSRKV